MITSFTGDHEFLSNFHEEPFPMATARFVWMPPPSCPDRWWFNSAEHAFQAAKATTHEQAIIVVNAPSPYLATRAGRKVTCQQDWELAKRRIMLEVLLAKFGHSADLRNLLRATGTAVLVEGNDWGDRYWGAVSVEGKGAWPKDHGTPYPGWPGLLAGHNWLGRILMMVREVL